MAERVIYGTLGSKGLKKVTAGNLDILAAAKALKEPYQKISFFFLMKCICKNVKSVVEEVHLEQTRMENFIKELCVLR